jgi:endoglucanase
VIGILSVVVVALVALTVVPLLARRPAPTASLPPTPANPLHGVSFFVDPASPAAAAATSDPEFAAIADEPAAIWLLPEEHDTRSVGAYVGNVAAAAARTATWPIFVVYGVPKRDCLATQSAGGAADDSAYREWVQAIAAALPAHAVVVLEPDALALADQCHDRDARIAQLRSAIELLAPTGATVYIDAGHSDWVPPDEMAALLREVGVAKVRGFASNVSNFETTAAERRYDEQVSAALGGSHYVIDTSRNGRGPTRDQAWCNPAGRGLGAPPRVVEDGTGLDATLWIKNPGESDGACNGGPSAGQWWPEGARALIAGGE